MDKAVFNEQHIIFDERAKTQDEAYKIIAEAAYKAGFVRDQEVYYQGLWEREKEATTGFQDGIAIPHSKNDTCLKPGIFLVKFAHPIEWNALDGNPVSVAIALTIPQEGGETHLRILSKIARKLINEEFRNGLKNGTTPEALYQVLHEVEL